MNVVFDFGAVLFTWRPQDILAEVFPDRAADAAQAQQLARDVFGHEDWFAFDRGLATAEEASTRTAQRLGLCADTLHALVVDIPARRLQPMVETLEILNRLHARRQAGEGVQGLYFLSNMPAPYARVLEQNHAFLQQFDGGIFSGDVRLSKPDARIYQLLQCRHGLDPSRTVFIDDMQENVAAANALGWRGIHFTSAAQVADFLRQEHGL